MRMNLLAYQDVFVISGKEYQGRRNMQEGTALVPYTEEPDVSIGEIVIQKMGNKEVLLKVIDLSLSEGGTLNVGTKHPHMLTLIVENTTSQAHLSTKDASVFNIGSVTGTNVQMGNHNSLSVNISLQELTEHIAKSGDLEAKSKLKDFLNNSTVASLIGAGTAALIAVL